MKKRNVKAVILILSIFALLIVHVIKGEDIAWAIGAMVWEVAIGLVIGGLVFFNILLFFYNLVRPDNKLLFDVIDKFIAGVWTMVIIKAFGLF